MNVEDKCSTSFKVVRIKTIATIFLFHLGFVLNIDTAESSSNASSSIVSASRHRPVVLYTFYSRQAGC